MTEEQQNERLLAIAQLIYDFTEEWNEKRTDINVGFDCGYLHAAQTIIEQQIDPDYAPFVTWQNEQPEKRLLRVLLASKCDGTHAGPRCADPGCWNQ